MTAEINADIVVVERSLNAPPERVWQAITNADQMKHWCFDVHEFRPEVGFEFQFTAGGEDVKYLHVCKVLEVVPGKKLVYSWRFEGYAGNSQVTFQLLPEGSGTRLKLTHKGLASFPQIPDFTPGNFEKGWTQIIGSSLKHYLESADAGSM